MIKVQDENKRLAYAQINQTCNDVVFRDDVLYMRDPLDAVLPVDSYTYNVYKNRAKYSMCLCYTYVKWTIFYYIREAALEIEGTLMFEGRPDNMDLTFIDFLKSYCAHVWIDGVKKSYLITSYEHAVQFVGMFNAAQMELAAKKLGYIFFDGAQAVYQAEDAGTAPRNIHYLDCSESGRDIMIHLVGEEEPITLKRVQYGINVQALINLDRGDKECLNQRETLH
ncbi:MAG: hypothetical protein RSC43_00455 [Clostridia bacterium]